MPIVVRDVWCRKEYASCYLEELVEDVHAILLFLSAPKMSVQCLGPLWRCAALHKRKVLGGVPYLVAWEHVNALSVAVVQAPILFVVGEVASHGRRLMRVGTGRQRYLSVWLSMNEAQATWGQAERKVIARGC